MISDWAALAPALARWRAAGTYLERIETERDLPAPADLAEALLAARAENEQLRAQLDAAVRRVPSRCAGARCEGRGVFYPSDGEDRCLACAGRA